MKALIHSIEPLESRIAPATFLVTSNANSGACRRRNKTGKDAGTKVDSGLQSKSG